MKATGKESIIANTLLPITGTQLSFKIYTISDSENTSIEMSNTVNITGPNTDTKAIIASS